MTENDGGARAPYNPKSVVTEGERTERSILLRGLSFHITPVEQIGEIVSVFHGEVRLPSVVKDSGRVRFRVPHGPAVHEFSHLVSHDRSLAQ